MTDIICHYFNILCSEREDLQNKEYKFYPNGLAMKMQTQTPQHSRSQMIHTHRLRPEWVHEIMRNRKIQSHSRSRLTLNNGEFVAKNKALDRNFWLHSFTIFTIQRLPLNGIESRRPSTTDLNIVNCKLKIECIPQLAGEKWRKQNAQRKNENHLWKINMGSVL